MSAVARDAVDIGVDGGQSRTRLRVVQDGSIRCADGVSRLEGDPADGVVAAVLQAWRCSPPPLPVTRWLTALWITLRASSPSPCLQRSGK